MPLHWGIYKSATCRAFSNCILLPKDFDVAPIGQYAPPTPLHSLLIIESWCLASHLCSMLYASEVLGWEIKVDTAREDEKRR